VVAVWYGAWAWGAGDGECLIGPRLPAEGERPRCWASMMSVARVAILGAVEDGRAELGPQIAWQSGGVVARSWLSVCGRTSGQKQSFAWRSPLQSECQREDSAPRAQPPRDGRRMRLERL
jgi:hypothetical protein